MAGRTSFTSGLGEAKQSEPAMVTNGSGSQAAAALATAASLVVAGVALARQQYKQYKSEKHLKSVKQILELYKAYLVNITISGSSEHPTLPSPFRLDDQESPQSASALLLNQAIRADLLKDRTVTSDAFLLKYSQHIQTAKQHIVRFYDARLNPNGRSAFTRGTEDDVTSSVLTYLLIMLSEHCTKFEGYDVDIAILSGIISFIRGFVSMPRESIFGKGDPRKRQRFEILKLACQDLTSALCVLRDHSNSRTLKSYVDELMSVCNKELIPDLSNAFTKLIMPEESWASIDSAPMSWIAAGFVQAEFKHGPQPLLRKKSSILLPNAIFKSWLQGIAAFRMDPGNVIKAPIELREENFSEIKSFFKSCPNLLTLKAPQPIADGAVPAHGFVPVGFDKECYIQISSRMPTTVLKPYSFLVIREVRRTRVYEIGENRQSIELELSEVPQLETALKELPPKPAESLTRRDLKYLNAVLTTYRNSLQLKGRARIFLHLALLLDQLTDLDQFCQKLSNCIRDLGEIYINNPHHCSFIFESLTALGRDINDRIGALLSVMERLEKEQGQANDLFLRNQADLGMQLQNKLDYIQRRVTNNIDGIATKHLIHNARVGNARAAGKVDYAAYEKSKQKQEIQGMLMHATAVAIKYHIDTRKYDLQTVERALEEHFTPASTPALNSRTLGSRRPSVSVNLRALGSGYSPPSNLRNLYDRRSSVPDFKEEFKEQFKELKPFRFQSGNPAQPLHESQSEPRLPQPQQQSKLVLRRLVNAAARARISDPEELKEDPTETLAKIRRRLREIYVEDKVDDKTHRAYEHLYQALNGLNIKVKKMEQEKNLQDRIAKLASTKQLTILLCGRTLKFLKLEKEKRASDALHFSANEIRDELALTGYRFLDEHKSEISKFLRALKELALCLLGYGFYLAYKRGGFFRTNTRAAVHEVEKSSAELSSRLTVSLTGREKMDG